MNMSRKNYIEFAGIIRTSKSFDDLKAKLCDYLRYDNPKFDRMKFLRACTF